MIQPFAEIENSASIAHQFLTNGYIVMRGLLPRAYAQNARDAYLRRLYDFGLTSSPISDIPTAQLINNIDISGWRRKLLSNLSQIQTLNEAIHHPEILNAANLIGGTQYIPLPSVSTRIGIPINLKTREYAAIHQDYQGVQGGMRTLSCWVSLGDYQPHDGGLSVAHGSHILGCLPHEVDDEEHVQPVGSLGMDWRVTHFNLGDVVIFHPCLVHCGLPTKTGRLRISFDFRLHPPVDSIAHAAIGDSHLHYGYEYGELYKTFHNFAYTWYWKKYSIPTRPFDLRYQTERARTFLGFCYREQGTFSKRYLSELMQSQYPMHVRVAARLLHAFIIAKGTS